MVYRAEFSHLHSVKQLDQTSPSCLSKHAEICGPNVSKITVGHFLRTSSLGALSIPGVSSTSTNWYKYLLLWGQVSFFGVPFEGSSYIDIAQTRTGMSCGSVGVVEKGSIILR